MKSSSPFFNAICILVIFAMVLFVLMSTLTKSTYIVEGVTEDPLVFMYDDTTLVQLSDQNFRNAACLVLSDIHYAKASLKKFLDVSPLRCVIIAGDLVEWNRNSIDDEQELRELFTLFTHYDKLFFILPGNHEGKYYSSVFSDFTEYTNLIDLSRFRYIDLQGLDIISVPGYHLSEFTAPGGIVYTSEDVEDAARFIHYANDKVLLVAHGPPRTSSSDGIDFSFEHGHVGDSNLRKLMNEENIRFGIFGHVHEAGGNAQTMKDELVLEERFVDSLWVNAGPVTSWEHNSGRMIEGQATVFVFNDRQAKYRLLELADGIVIG